MGRKASLTINGGVVTAQGGIDAGEGGTVTIDNGVVTASGGITGGTVTITGGDVTATGGSGGAGVGSGMLSTSTVTIDGGVVNATGGRGSAGIGSRYETDDATVIINGGVVSATGSGGAGVGGNQASLTINGGSVKGGVAPQSVNGNGEPVYLLPLSNPGGKTVTVNGRTWSGVNHAAADSDETLYMYLSETDAEAGVAVGSKPTERYRLNTQTNQFESAGIVEDGTAGYYDPGTGAKKQAENVVIVKDGVTAWENGWYVASGAVGLDAVTVSGDVNLILPKGTSLTVSQSITVQDGGSLTVWGDQSDYIKDVRWRSRAASPAAAR